MLKVMAQTILVMCILIPVLFFMDMGVKSVMASPRSPTQDHTRALDDHRRAMQEHTRALEGNTDALQDYVRSCR